MKLGYTFKNVANFLPQEDDITLINKLTRRDFSSEEIYTFNVILCDNEIDRDFEKFSFEALQILSKLFVGKTGILDHDAKSKNQTARIYFAGVEKVANQLNSLGEPYYRLKAKAYIPICKKNDEIILEIDSGIKKEISVGCSVEKLTCSVCGANHKNNSCNHTKGKKYGKKLCYLVLEDPLDAYEWSFVAVPAQKKAGVIKQLNLNKKDDVCFKPIQGGEKLQDVILQQDSKKEISLTQKQYKQLGSYIKELQNLAELGKEYQADLKKEVIKLITITEPALPSHICKNVVNKMDLEELKIFKKTFEEQANKIMPLKPQLHWEKDQAKTTHEYQNYKI